MSASVVRRERAAGDVAEVPRPGRRDDSGIDGSRHRLDDLERVGRPVGERAAQRGGEVLHGHVREHRALGERVDEVGRDLGRTAQELPLVAHRERVYACV
jgi:hypothetical protein